MNDFTKEDHNRMVDELYEHGELTNNLKLLHYGCLLSQAIKRFDCDLTQLLGAINEAAQKQVRENNFAVGKL